MTDKEYDDDIEAKMLQMFGDESKENNPNENVRRSSRSRKKTRHYKDEQKAAIVHKVEKKYKTFSIEYHELDSEDLGNESVSDRASSSFCKEEDNPSLKEKLKTSKKRGRPKSSGSKTEGENSKKTLKTLTSTYRPAGRKQRTAYFMRGDVMWYVAKKARSDGNLFSHHGIKGCQKSELSNLPLDQSIIMELRVALDETCYKERNKKFSSLKVISKNYFRNTIGFFFNNFKLFRKLIFFFFVPMYNNYSIA